MAKEPMRYDGALGLEAYVLQRTEQPFPPHFHPYYVMGLVETGHRRLCCKGKYYGLGPGQLLLLNPGDSHGCVPIGGGLLRYRGLNLAAETVRQVLPGAAFPAPVAEDAALRECFLALHGAVMEGAADNRALLEELLVLAADRRDGTLPDPDEDGAVARARAYMESHLTQRVTLEQLCRCSGLSKSTLLRSFTAAMGITPYRYLQSLRVLQAGRLLNQGMAPAQAAQASGFSDQSHLSREFHRLTGLSPGACRRAHREDTHHAT